MTDVNGKVQPTEKDLESKKTFLEDNSQHPAEGDDLLAEPLVHNKGGSHDPPFLIPVEDSSYGRKVNLTWADVDPPNGQNADRFCGRASARTSR